MKTCTPISNFDPIAIRERFSTATPFPSVCIDNFLQPDFALSVFEAYPTFEESRKIGKGYSNVNEKAKIQVTDAEKFPGPVAELNRALADPELLSKLAEATGIPGLMADDQLVGGGMHQTGPRGLLDVHVDFNRLKDRGWFRRLNIILFLNKEWQDSWGGRLELWDREVRKCHHSFLPIFNRCVIFETSEISYHGVTAVTCPENVTRKSFAAYYYSQDPPADWSGQAHSTQFRARPNEKFKGLVLMPARKARKAMKSYVDRIKSKFGLGDAKS